MTDSSGDESTEDLRRLSSDPHSIDLPYEDNPPGQTVPLDDARIASGVVIAAAVMPVPGRGPMPCLVYRFATPNGSGFYPPIALVVNDQQMRALAQLTAETTTAAVKAAGQGVSR